MPKRTKPHEISAGRTILKPLMRGSWRVLRTLMRAVRAAPPIIRIAIILPLLFTLWFGMNWAYQAFQKPSEVLFPLEKSLVKNPEETWRQYEPLFREHATATITPEFLAALAQVEGGGNPVARTYWRWQLTGNPFEWYRPASSAVGMFQITDGTFEEATHYCIHDHVVVEDGPWNDWHSCWFNIFYTRILPSHAIELTAAFLDRRVQQTLDAKPGRLVTFRQKQDLAAIIHLCGAGAGRAYATRGFRLTSHQKCGDHDAGKYLTRIHGLQHRFSKGRKIDETIRQGP